MQHAIWEVDDVAAENRIKLDGVRASSRLHLSFGNSSWREQGEAEKNAEISGTEQNKANHKTIAVEKKFGNDEFLHIYIIARVE